MSVVWRRLALAGFGRFEDETIVEFDDGFNVLVAPNESGKSTLAVGLAAVLFGLPASSNPDAFGQARWRNWREPPRFEGELQFSSDGKTYRIRRRFADHAVTVSERTDQGWRDIVTGMHNPNARRRNERYESFLQQIIGVVDAQLFMQTFFVTQPLPATRVLDENVQQLISGAGAERFAAALKVLEQQAKGLTKYTKELGITARDAVKDGELEVLERRIDELRELTEVSRAALDERQAMQQRLAQLQAEAQEMQRQLERLEAEIDAWNEWQKLRDEHRQALHEQSRLERAWETYKKLSDDAEDARRRMAAQYPELLEAPADTETLLDELQRLEDELTAKRRQLEVELGALRRRGAELTQEWREFVRRREEWRSLSCRMETEFSVFENADEQARRLLATYGATKAALALQVDRARRELEAARAAWARAVAERERFHETFGDLEMLGDDAVQAVDERLRQLEERERLQASLATAQARHERRRRRAVGTWLFISLGTIAGAAGAYLGGASTTNAVVLGIAGAAMLLMLLAFVVPRLRTSAELEELTERLRAVEEALAADERLGPFKEAPVRELGGLRERLLARRQAAAALAEREAAEPDEKLWERLRQAEEEYRRFVEATAPAEARFGARVEDAYEEWSRLRQEAERLQEALLAFSRRHFGVATMTPEDVPVGRLDDDGLAAVWRDVAQLVLDAGFYPNGDASRVSPADIADAVPQLTDAHLAAAARAREARRADFAALHKALDDLTRRIKPVLAAADGSTAEAKRRWSEYTRALALAEGLEKERSGVLAGQGVASADELHLRSRQAANVAVDAYRRLQRLAEEHPFLPRAEDDPGVDVRSELRRLAARREEMKARWRALEEELLAVRAQLADLTGRNVLNVAAAEEELKALLRRREQLAREARIVALAHHELRAAADAFRQTHRERLAERASAYMQRFSGRARRVVLDEEFRVSVQDPDGPLHSVTQLSQGAQDQLYFALRLAVADLIADDVALPLLLDDPFVNSDDERLQRIREALAELSTSRQVVLLTHRELFQGWGAPVSLLSGGDDG